VGDIHHTLSAAGAYAHSLAEHADCRYRAATSNDLLGNPGVTG
jgi:hypothetical protein